MSFNPEQACHYKPEKLRDYSVEQLIQVIEELQKKLYRDREERDFNCDLNAKTLAAARWYLLLGQYWRRHLLPHLPEEKIKRLEKASTEEIAPEYYIHMETFGDVPYPTIPEPLSRKEGDHA